MSLSIVPSVVEAQHTVERIAEKFGWASPTIRQQSHEYALETIERLQLELGEFTRKLAEGLQGSISEFVSEMIQNADANRYSKAEALGEDPYIKFMIHSGVVIVEYNEDGFTHEDVRALCLVDEKKRRTNGGRNGIGFKSVFMIASKVHVQSGPFSFSFAHDSLDHGMGMIVPEWESSGILSASPLTRLTLTLRDTIQFPDCLGEFESIPQTLLLFLKNLRRVTFEEHLPGDWVQSLTYSCEVDPILGRCRLNESVDAPDPLVIQSTSREYHVVHERVPLVNDRDWRGEAVVSLAFLVKATCIEAGVEQHCVIKSDQFAAYLPIPELGFPFIIDSEFVTEADLRDILRGVSKTLRNETIFESAVEAFTDTIAEFCEDSILQYQWPKYILEEEKTPAPHWSELGNRIKERLKTQAVLWPRSRNCLRLISELRIVGQNFLDQNGQPLVPDQAGEKEFYLDAGYSTDVYDALPKLRALGLKTMTIYECINRITHDATSPDSRMRSADDDWHERTASLLLVMLENKNDQDKSAKWIQHIKSLPLIPLVDHRWVAITSGPVFFPNSDGCQIPRDLGLRLVDPRATMNATRKKLLTKLGVEEVSPDLVKSLILEKHKNQRANVSLQTSVHHLHYLFSTSQQKSLFAFGDKFRRDIPFALFDELGLPVDDNSDLYLDTKGEFDAKALLALTREGNAPETPNFFGTLINKEYFKSAPELRSGPTKVSPLEDWLKYNMQVFSHPQLVDNKDRSKLSLLFLYLLEKHPTRAFGTLKQHWSWSYQSIFSWNPNLKQHFLSIMISSTNIGEMAIGRIFLPLRELQARCSQFLKPIHFPFLQLPKNEGETEDWKFLQVLGIGVEMNLDFYLEILRQYKYHETQFSYKIYEAIQKRIWAVGETWEIAKRIRKIFITEDLICIATPAGDKHIWTTSEKCFWDGPPRLTLVHTLLPALSWSNSPVITAFFVETLCIPNVSYTYLLEELELIYQRCMHVTPTVDPAQVRDIYDYLNAMIPSLSHKDVEAIRNTFETKALIYEPSHKTWASIASSIWSKEVHIPGKVTISHHYANLKNLFVRTLKVKIQDLSLLVDELTELVSLKEDEPLVRDVKSLIWQINELSPSTKDLESLKDLPIFPVTLANKHLDYPSMQTENSKFAINDRQPFADAFESKIDVLAFELEEVRKLQPFLSCFNLKGRYLSQAVTEKSSLKDKVSRRQRNRELTVRFRNRAYALARCAAHFHSPRILEDDEFIFDLFQHAEVYQTNAIRKTLTHALYETLEVEVNTAKLHISENLGVVKIYVPELQRDQEQCFRHYLPIRLFNEVLMNGSPYNSTTSSDWEAVRIIAAVLDSSYDTIPNLLDEAGIISVPYHDIIDLDSDDEADSIVPEPAVEADARSRTPISFDPDGYQRYNRAPSPEVVVHPNQLTTTSPNTPVPLPPRVFRPFRVESVQKDYIQLLDNVIAVAQGKGGMLPSKGLYNFDSWHDALREDEPEEDIYSYPYYSPLGFRSREQKEHNLKMGAAGELYVFEVLSKLKLPSFDRGNWQSRIRHYVAGHAKYKDLEEWHGQDVDMVYADKAGSLTEILMDKGQLGKYWSNATPTYWLEVKTTTRKCGARFYLTENEHKRMGSMKLSQGQTSFRVYIILRVFDLDKETIGMRLLVDPAGMEERGELRITQMSGGSFSVQDISGS